MKILALITVAPDVGMDAIGNSLIDELMASWDLYRSDVLREAYATQAPGRIAFVLEAQDAAQAGQILGQLPLVAAGCFAIDITELRPFGNWSRLFQS